MIYVQPSNASFSKKIESFQYNAALGTMGAIKGSSRNQLYHELYLYQRILSLFYKFFSTVQPSCINNLLTSVRSSHRHSNLFYCRTEYFKNSFIPNVIDEWNKLDPCIRSSTFVILLLTYFVIHY